MALHPKAKAWIDIISSFAKTDYGSIDVNNYRSMWTHFMSPVFVGDKLPLFEIKDVDIPFKNRKISIRIYRPNVAQIYPTFFYLPGGGFIIKNLLETHDALCRRLCLASQWQIISIQYCAAPEYPFPEAIHELLYVIPYMVRNNTAYNIDKKAMVMGGDSSGAHLAAITVQQLHPRQASFLGQILISPPLDAARSRQSYQQYQEGYLLDKAYMDWIYKLYLTTDANLQRSLISPLQNKNLSALPKTLIVNAEYDPVRDDGEQYAIQLCMAGVDTSYICYPGLIHAFLLFRGREALAETVDPIEDICQFLNRYPSL